MFPFPPNLTNYSDTLVSEFFCIYNNKNMVIYNLKWNRFDLFYILLLEYFCGVKILTNKI